LSDLENKIFYPLIGDKFPEIKVQTTHGEFKLPDHYKKKWFVLFSYPADFTPVSATEFVAFTKRYEEFQNLNCELIGLSLDQVYSHIKWIEWIKQKFEVEIPFPIIADLGKLANILGTIHPQKGENSVRSVFVVGPKGIIKLIMFYPQEVGRFLDEILRVVEACQVADQENVFLPVNWPKHEFLGRQVLIPPAKDQETAKQQPKEYGSYDWWFCYKSLEYG